MSMQLSFGMIFCVCLGNT